MDKYIYILIGIFIFISCQENEKKDMLENVNEDELIQSELSLSEIEANNENIKIDYPQIIQVEEVIHCTGSIRLPPSSVYSVHSKISGSIKSIHVQEGDKVKRGRLLFTLNDPLFIEKQRVFLETKEQYLWAEKEYERKKSLVNKKTISGTDFDLAQGNFKKLSASYNGMKSELKLLGIDIEKLEIENSFQLSIPIYAQSSGIIDEVFVNTGQRVSPEILMTRITKTDDVYLALNVLAKDIPLLQVGQEVEFMLPKMERALHAKVEKLSPVLDEEKGSMTVYCEIDKSDCSHIISGMFVNAKILVGTRQVKALAPSAYLKEGLNYYGFVVNGDALEKINLDAYEIFNDHIILPDSLEQKMLINGAYYIE